MGDSPKFKWLKHLAKDPEMGGLVPVFVPVGALNSPVVPSLFQDGKTRILRTGRADEGGESVSAGRGHSVKDIRLAEDFHRALERLQSDPAVKEIILQEQIQCRRHYTVLSYDGLIYAETTFGPQSRLFVAEDTRVGHIPDENEIVGLSKRVAASISRRRLLFEWGVSGRGAHLFQVIELGEQWACDLVAGPLVQAVLACRNRWVVDKSLLDLIREEISAWRLRRKPVSNPDWGWIFANWMSLMHYFHLYCLIHRRAGSAADLADFYSHVSGSWGFLAHAALAHMRLANSSAGPGEKFQQGPGLGDGPYFIGSGCVEGKAGVDFRLAESLEPAIVYSENRPILTLDKHLLGHGFLAAIERQVPVVAAIGPDIWRDLKPGTGVVVDFNSKTLTLK